MIKMIFNDLDKMLNLTAEAKFVYGMNEKTAEFKRLIVYQRIKKKYLGKTQ